MQAEPGREGASQPSSGLERLRPRVAGAVAAVLVAGFALAALVAPSSLPRATLEKAQAAPIPVTAQALLPVAAKSTVPPGGVVEQTSTAIDDGVPTALNETRRLGGDCHHGL
jgi:hypothetical protein